METRTRSTAGADVCPVVEQAFGLLGKKWTGLVIHVIGRTPCRFSDLLHTVPGLSARVLAQRLRELGAEGIVQRDVFPESPVRIDYSLTEKGRALLPVMARVADWAHKWVEE